MDSDKNRYAEIVIELIEALQGFECELQAHRAVIRMMVESGALPAAHEMVEAARESLLPDLKRRHAEIREQVCGLLEAENLHKELRELFRQLKPVGPTQ